MLKSLVVFVVLVTLSSALLWRIERSPPSYIFGTRHVPYDWVWPYVSNETRQAFLSSTHFYGELDASDEYWEEFLQCIMKTSNRTRRSRESILDFPRKSIPFPDPVKPVQNAELLDIHLFVTARLLNKTVGSLESAEYNCQREGHRFSASTWMFLVRILQQEIRNRTFNIDPMTNSSMKKYLCETLDGRSLGSLMNSNTFRTRLEERDKQMAGYIHRLLHSSDDHRYFFALGIGHMLTEGKNLLVRLESLGYRIHRVCPEHVNVRKKLGCRKKKTLKHCMKKK